MTLFSANAPFKPKASRFLRIVMIIFCSIGLLWLPWLAIPWEWKILVGGVSVAVVVCGIRRHVFEFEWNKGIRWKIYINDTVIEAELLDNSFVHRWLCILNFKTSIKRYTAIIMPDSLSELEQRRLRRIIRGGF